MFDGILWDNDGVLMETEHLYCQANAEALEAAINSSFSGHYGVPE